MPSDRKSELNKPLREKLESMIPLEVDESVSIKGAKIFPKGLYEGTVKTTEEVADYMGEVYNEAAHLISQIDEIPTLEEHAAAMRKEGAAKNFDLG